ncbi:WD40 repeat domain-containing protein [Streptomyces netropsis]|uniref:WD40 repeat domain-containing protein n=1 Tax=Streptomyces netropsis TaxID=55404 RepID=UPI0037AE8E6B
MRSIDLGTPGAGHAAPVTHVAWHRENPRLATASYDGTVGVWDVTGGTVRRIRALRHRRLVNCAAWNPLRRDVLATASADKTVAVWDLADDGPSPARLLARHTDDVNSVAWLPDGARLACVSEDGRATLWDAEEGRFLATLTAHTAHCMAVDVSHRGTIATVGEDGLVSLITPDSGAQDARRQYETSVEGCAWSPSGSVLAIARDDGYVDVLDEALDVVLSVRVCESATRSVAWAQDGAVLVVGAYDGHVHFLRAVDGGRLGRYENARAWPRSVAVGHSMVAVGSFSGAPLLLDAGSRRGLGGTEAPTHGVNALAVTGERLAMGCDSGLVVDMDIAPALAGGLPSMRTVRYSEGPVLSLAARPDGLYAGTYSGHVVCRSGERVTSLALGGPVTSLAPHGTSVVAGTYNGDIIELDGTRALLGRRRRAHDGSVKSLAPLAPSAFLSAATDHTVMAGTVTERTRLWRHGNLVNAVASLDGTVAASASRDHTVRVGTLERRAGAWRVRRSWTLLGADESVKAVGLLGPASAPVVLAGSYDFSLRVWRLGPGGGDLTSGDVLHEFDQAVSCITRIDRDTAAVAGWDGRLLLVSVARGRPEVVAGFDIASSVGREKARRWLP